MKNLKKLIAVVLTFALVFSAMAVGFAATTPFTDVKNDAPYASAVARLYALNITNGNTDGTYGVDQPVTRAMMTVFVNRLSGYRNLAEMAKNDTPAFKDVSKNYWAVGDINLAAKLGLTHGVGNGMFAPEEKVTYAQALGFMLNALGYKNLSWPYGVVAQAQKLGLTTGINRGFNDVINRGDLAIIMNRALDCTVVSYDANGNIVVDPNTGLPKGQTLLASGLTYLGYTQTTGVVTNVTAAQATITPTTGNAVTVNVGSVDFKSLIGQNVTVYVKNGTALIAVPTGNTIITTTQITNDTVAGTIYYVASDNTVKTIPVADNNNVVIYNGQTLTTKLSDSTTLGYVKGSSATLIDNNNDGKVEYIIATKYTAPEKIRFIDATNKVVYANGTYNLGAANVTYTITKNGKAATFADLAVGDVIQVAASPDGTIYQILASSNTVTGKVVEVKPLTKTIKLDNGVEYGFASGAPVSYSNFTAGNTYTLYLDSNGKIYDAKVVTATYAANYAYVVNKGKVTDAFGNATYKFQIVKPDGTTAVYDLVDNVTAYNGTTVSTNVYNDIWSVTTVPAPITYDVNANGQFTNVSPVTLPVSGSASVDQTNKTLTIGTTTYYVTDSTVIYQVYNGTVKPIKFADIGTGNKAVKLSTTGSFNQVQYLQVNDAIAPITTGTVGVYEGYALVAGGYKLYVNVNGTDTAYTVLTSAPPTTAPFAYGDIITFGVDSNGNATNPAKVDVTRLVNGEVYAISNTFINIGGTVKPLDPAVKVFKLVKDTSGNVTGVTTASFGEIVPQQTGTDANGNTIVYVHGSNVNAYVDATTGKVTIIVIQ